MKNIAHIYYTQAHRKMFRKVEKQLLGHNTFRSLFHDLDKVLMYPFIDERVVNKIHRKHSRHHNKAKTTNDYIQMVIDWECARFTKPDKPLNARETLYKYYPELIDKITPILERFNL